MGWQVCVRYILAVVCLFNGLVPASDNTFPPPPPLHKTDSE